MPLFAFKIDEVKRSGHNCFLKLINLFLQYTISGKKVEIAVRNVIEDEEVKNIGALRNPQSLECYRNIPELASFA